MPGDEARRKLHRIDSLPPVLSVAGLAPPPFSPCTSPEISSYFFAIVKLWQTLESEFARVWPRGLSRE